MLEFVPFFVFAWRMYRDTYDADCEGAWGLRPHRITIFHYKPADDDCYPELLLQTYIKHVHNGLEAFSLPACLTPYTPVAYAIPNMDALPNKQPPQGLLLKNYYATPKHTSTYTTPNSLLSVLANPTEYAIYPVLFHYGLRRFSHRLSMHENYATYKVLTPDAIQLPSPAHNNRFIPLRLATASLLPSRRR